MRKVLLTVPHANCGCPGAHLCDTVAGDVADTIHRHMPDIALPPFVPQQARGRCDCDLNRLACRNDPWRREVARGFPNARFLLDVHSFPPSSDWGDYDAVVLDNSQLRKEYTLGFLKYLAWRGYRAKAVLGGDNDIENEAREGGVPSFLLEVNEGMAKEKRDALAKDIAEWLTGF